MATTPRFPRIFVAGLVVAIVAIAATHAYQSVASSSPTTATSPITVPHVERHAALGEAAGAVPEGTTVFDDQVPGVAKLDPALLSALRRAASDAARYGIRFVVNSGWRSAAYEDHLRREAVSKYGSEQEAARWVATGTTSPHVKGEAIDIGPYNATA